MFHDSDLFAAMTLQTTEAFAVMDATGRIVFANEACATLLGVSAPALVGESIVDRVHPDDLHRAVTVVTGVSEGAQPRPGLVKVRQGDGSWTMLEVSAAPIVLDDTDGASHQLVALVLRDNLFQETHWNFLAALSADQPFEDCLEVLATGLSSGPDGPLVINVARLATRDGRADDDRWDERVLVGPLPRRLGGLTDDGTLDLTPGAPWTIALETGVATWAAVEDLPADVRDLARSHGLAACVAVPIPDPGHDWPALMLQWPPWTTMAGLLAEALTRRPRQGMSLALERRFAMNRLEQLAHHDGLTGLVNRERFFQLLGEYDAADTSYAVFYIDLDQFKPVNDTFGHMMGDRVIAACANRLQHLSRPGDIVARLGGDEFGVACVGMDQAGAEAMAERIVDALAAPIALSATTVVVGASVGCSVRTPALGADGVVAKADAALYDAKRAGRNRWALQ